MTHNDVKKIIIPQDKRVSVVICTFNEERNLPYVLKKLPPWVFEVIMVDGNSKDNTVKIAKELYPSIKILYQPGKGKGDALTYGFDNALGDIIIALDADGSTDPNELFRFVQPLTEDYGMCKGSRFIKGGSSEDISRFRIFGNWVFTQLTNLMFGSKYSDLAYGYFGFTQEAWKRIQPKSDGFAIETEINIKAIKRGIKTIEVPSQEKRRLYGEGKLHSFRDGWKILVTIFKERLSS
ncbi:glycosyltransferase family 2 protein [Chloroflexota bacterium]